MNDRPSYPQCQYLGDQFGGLIEGQEVEFEKGQGHDGRACAVSVRLAQPKDK